MQLKKRYFAIIGFLILFYILININIEETIQNLLKANLFYIAISVLISLFSLFIRSIRWKLFIEQLKGKISIKQTYFYFLAAFFPSLTTPGRIGEFLKVFFISDILSFSKSFASVLSDRIYDIFALFGFAFLSSFLVVSILSKTLIEPWIILILLIFGICLFFILTKTQFFPILTEKIARTLMSEEKANKLKISFSNLSREISQLFFNPVLFLKATILTLFSWVLSFLGIYFLLLSLNIPSDIILPLLIVSLVAITDLLPISISGMGTREATLIAIFALYSLTPEQAVSFSALYFIIFNIFMILFSYPFFSLSSAKIKL